MEKQPKNFGFGEEEAMVKSSARKFFSDNCPIEKIHSQVANQEKNSSPGNGNWDRRLWEKMVEMGWPSLNVAESSGGVGMPLCAAVAIAEEAGRAAVPSPLIPTFCSSFVLNQCPGQAAEEALNQITQGTAVSLGITNSKGSSDPSQTETEIKGNKLYGATYYVQDAQKAEKIIVSAKGSSGTGLYLLDTQSKGVQIIPDLIVDLTRDQAHIIFDGAPCIELAKQTDGAAALSAALPAMLTIVSADMVGAGEWLLQTTAEYAKTRVQFDHPIGFFQAIKHPLVNVMIEIDKAKSLTYNAACSIDFKEDSAEVNARMAKAQASEMAVFSASRAVQFHGGIGFTWECFVHISFKRQMHNQVLYGDAKHHRRILSDLCIGQIN